MGEIDKIAADVPDDPNAPVSDYGQRDRINVGGFETKLITMDPTEAQSWVERFPGHGNKEASSKISDIMTYGPDYASRGRATRMEELEALAKYWDLDVDEVRRDLETFFEYAPEHREKTEEFLRQNAHLFGGGEQAPEAPEAPAPEAPAPEAPPEGPPSPV